MVESRIEPFFLDYFIEIIEVLGNGDYKTIHEFNESRFMGYPHESGSVSFKIGPRYPDAPGITVSAKTAEGRILSGALRPVTPGRRCVNNEMPGPCPP
jgi:hypothetical protein